MFLEFPQDIASLTSFLSQKRQYCLHTLLCSQLPCECCSRRFTDVTLSTEVIIPWSKQKFSVWGGRSQAVCCLWSFWRRQWVAHSAGVRAIQPVWEMAGTEVGVLEVSCIFDWAGSWDVGSVYVLHAVWECCVIDQKPCNGNCSLPALHTLLGQ